MYIDVYYKGIPLCIYKREKNILIWIITLKKIKVSLYMLNSKITINIVYIHAVTDINHTQTTILFYDV